FAGGTVDWVSTREPDHALRAGVGAFEDGTPDFLAADAVHDGLDLLDGIGMATIERRTRALATLLLTALEGLRHPDGRAMVQVFGPPAAGRRGGTVAFNVIDGRGAAVPFGDVVAQAARRRVSVRG